jgi:dehydrogenase/reductase SDR family protein 12
MIDPLDTLLDRAVVPGYTSLGYRIRSRGWEADLPRMDGRTVLVTGATSGLGLAAAHALAGLGAGVRLLARSEERAELARSEIVGASGNEDVGAYVCDLSSMVSVRRAAARVAREEETLDVLVNNAGVLAGERALSVDGIELTFATNVLGPFLLTRLLAGVLARSAPARIINVSSGGMYTQRVDVDDLQAPARGYDGPRVYARTKREQVILSELWAERLAGEGVVVHAMHPGWAQTPGVESSLPRFHKLTRRLLRDPREGADTIVWLACAEEPARTTGGFWHDRRRRPAHLLPWTRENERDRERLWEACERLSGPARNSGHERARCGY